MCGIGPVREPYKGRPVRALCFGATFGWGQAEADRYSGAPAVLVSNCWCGEARERRPGEVLAKAFAGAP